MKTIHSDELQRRLDDGEHVTLDGYRITVDRALVIRPDRHRFSCFNSEFVRGPDLPRDALILEWEDA